MSDVSDKSPNGNAVPEDEILLDLTGLKCPLPALRVRKALARMADGAEFQVVCTDPMAAIDVPNTVRERGAILLEQRQEAGRLWFRILKSIR